jgi:anti-sigma regulatory factor (Ser/Thr protein kinase)
VSSRVLRGWLEVFVVDHGTGFDPESLPVRPPRTDPHHLDVERGWGIQLMRALVDELVYVSDEEGTALVLRCRLAPR